jgi:hypothetical protein
VGRPLGTALVCAAALACSPRAATQLVVVVDSDYVPVVELTEVTVRTAETTGTEIDRRSVRVGTDASIPFSFAVVPRGGDASRRVVLEVTGRIAGGPNVVRRVETGFVAGEARLLRVHLSRACSMPVTCPADEECERGRCVPIAIDPGTLPPWEGNEIGDAGTPFDARQAEDAPGSDTPAVDAPPDAPDSGGGDCTVEGAMELVSATGIPVAVGASTSSIGVSQIANVGANFIEYPFGGSPTSPTFLSASTTLAGGELRWRVIGWVLGLRHDDGQLDVVTYTPTAPVPTAARTAVGTSQHVPSVAGTAAGVLVGHTRVADAIPIVQFDPESDGIGFQPPVPLDTIPASSPVAVAWDPASGAIAGWVDTALQLQALGVAGTVTASGLRYALSGPEPGASEVAVARSTTRVAGVTGYALGSPGTAFFGLFEAASTSLLASFRVEPGGLVARNRVAIAMTETVVALAARAGGSFRGSEVWLVHVRMDGTTAEVRVATVDDTVAGGPWVFPAPGGGWLVAYLDDVPGSPGVSVVTVNRVVCR